MLSLLDVLPCLAYASAGDLAQGFLPGKHLWWNYSTQNLPSLTRFALMLKKKMQPSNSCSECDFQAFPSETDAWCGFCKMHLNTTGLLNHRTCLQNTKPAKSGLCCSKSWFYMFTSSNAMKSNTYYIYAQISNLWLEHIVFLKHKSMIKNMHLYKSFSSLYRGILILFNAIVGIMIHSVWCIFVV